jgi:uncharacterized protein (DUF2236 family)
MAPPGEPALLSADSVSWQVFKNPVSLLIGGIAAVILELAEPRVRSGVWEHTSFRRYPVTRLQRTGLAAMVTVFGARSTAEAMIANVRRIHDRVQGVTPSGMPYQASDPELLRWVHATAAYGFLQAYQAYVRPLPASERDQYYAEGELTACLYGVDQAPGSEEDLRQLFEATYPHLERSNVIFEFLQMMRQVAVLPPVLHLTQGMLVRAAVEITPAPVRTILGLGQRYSLRSWEAALARRAGGIADRVVLQASPAVQACVRLQHSADYLYRQTR